MCGEVGRCVGSLIAVLSVPVHCLCEGLAVVQFDTCSFHAYLFGASGGIRSQCVCVFVGGCVRFPVLPPVDSARFQEFVSWRGRERDPNGAESSTYPGYIAS